MGNSVLHLFFAVYLNLVYFTLEEHVQEICIIDTDTCAFVVLF